MRYAVALAALLLAATACSSDTDDPDRAADPAPQPAADEPSTIPTPVIVMDVARPELCTGPVAESYPPQCGGPPIRGWKWAHYSPDDYDQVGKVRWGEFVVEGHFDGEEFVVTSAEPA